MVEEAQDAYLLLTANAVRRKQVYHKDIGDYIKYMRTYVNDTYGRNHVKAFKLVKIKS